MKMQLMEKQVMYFLKIIGKKSKKGTDNRTGDHIDLWDGKGVNKMAS